MSAELKCENTEMVLSLPVSSLSNINLAELQLNNPTCPVTYNSTHLTARVSLDGCGTKRVVTAPPSVHLSPSVVLLSNCLFVLSASLLKDKRNLFLYICWSRTLGEFYKYQLRLHNHHPNNVWTVFLSHFQSR